MVLKEISSETQKINMFGCWGRTITRTFECACGKGTVVDEYDDIPGHRDHTTMLLCDDCGDKYTLAKIQGRLELVPKA